MTIEAYTNGAQILHTNRRRVQPIGGLSQAHQLGPNQLQYLIDKGWIDRRRVQRLAVTEPQLSLTLTEDK
jgi:hypothetical protein